MASHRRMLLQCAANWIESEREYMISVLKNIGMDDVKPWGAYYGRLVSTGKMIAQINRFICIGSIETALLRSFRCRNRFEIRNWSAEEWSVHKMVDRDYAAVEILRRNVHRKFIRVCFFKTDEKLQKMEKLLAEWTRKLRRNAFLVHTVEWNCNSQWEDNNFSDW